MAFGKKVYAAAGYSTIFYGPGRPEFNPKGPMPSFEEYLLETAAGSCQQLADCPFDEGIISNFMAPRFLKQAHLAAFLPFMVPALEGKPCTAVEGACGSGGRALAMAVRSVLSGLSNSVFVAGFEIQNCVKSVYGADILAGAAYYRAERKGGHAHFFPGIFDARAGAYYEKHGYELARQAMALWYENAVINARNSPKAQEHYNESSQLLERGLAAPDPKRFLPHLNLCDCSKVSDGAASIVIASEEGLDKCGIAKEEAVEIIALGEAESPINMPPQQLTALTTTALAARKAYEAAGITPKELSFLEIHDCFTITALLAFEALGLAPEGGGAHYIIEGKMRRDGELPTNVSGGLCGFGHPTGATGVRQLADLQQLLATEEPPTPYAMMVNMGGNDKTVTALVAKKCRS